MTTPRNQLPADLDSVVFSKAGESQGFVDYPIERVIEGQPRARIKVLRTRGMRTPVQHVALLSAEPSKFHYRFTYDEAFQIISGHLAISLDTGERVEMRAGDVVTIPAGHDSIFEIFEPSMKFVVVTGG